MGLNYETLKIKFKFNFLEFHIIKVQNIDNNG